MVSKLQERIYADGAAKLLFANWQIVDIPEPVDFEIRTPSEIFGLEVRQIFIEPEMEFGSAIRRNESKRMQMIRDLATDYYASGGSSVSVQILGSLSKKKFVDLIRSMIINAPSYPGPNQTITEHRVKVFMTPVPPIWGNYSRWAYVDDKVGWLREIKSGDLQPAIDKKKDKLVLYHQKYKNIDLLLVADRILNSGKLTGVGHLQVSNPGFRSIYFMSYPESIHHIT